MGELADKVKGNVNEAIGKAKQQSGDAETRGEGAAQELKGAELADSWATDGHKWLNVPYDCGYAFVAHPEHHRAAIPESRPSNQR